jgi:short-subunit dehydrogenase
MDIKGKVAIVTGASMGIGLVTAKLLSKKGVKLALVARSKDKIEKLTEELPNAIAICVDVSKVDDVKCMVKRVYDHFKRIDILINNAGQGYDASIEKIDPVIFRYLFDLDVLGQLVAIQEVVPIMRKQGGGAIVNISSGLALMHMEHMGAYAALKAALAHLSLTAREELKDDNISVSVLYPYITSTEFERHTIRNSPSASWGNEDSEETQEAWAKADPPDHIAKQIVEAIEKGDAEIVAHDWMRRAPTP